ncbi:hypothetical protein VU00_10431, partial [Candidatus Electrothrix marina]
EILLLISFPMYVFLELIVALIVSAENIVECAQEEEPSIKN